MKFFIALMVVSLHVFALETGKPAPSFTLKGLNPKSKDVNLADFKGKIVVLEWMNHGCPFVRKHYDSGNLQSLQKKYVERNVIWFSVISSAPGKQGHVDEDGALKDKKAYGSAATDILLDPTGAVGKTYGAKTTPHFFIIDKEGNLAYQGAIDNKADTEKSSVKVARNYVSEALDQLLVNRPVKLANTKAYGCSVKYAD